MTMQVAAFHSGGMASGSLAREGHLRDVLDGSPTLDLDAAHWQPLVGDPSELSERLRLPVDDVLIAVADDDPVIPVHASWHPVQLEIGPYLVDGELPTSFGYDPGRALTRPAGEFLLLRDVTITIRGASEVAPSLVRHALVNRYCVERVTADLMLGFYFPGATLDGSDDPPETTPEP
jgi:hypothetical protein